MRDVISSIAGVGACRLALSGLWISIEERGSIDGQIKRLALDHAQLTVGVAIVKHGNSRTHCNELARNAVSE